MIDEYFEDKISSELLLPHVVFPQETLSQKSMFAWHTSSLSGEEILLASSFAFSYEGLISGLNFKQIEYIAKNAPDIYKKELLNAINKNYKLHEIIEIVKTMDEDIKTGSTENQNRIKNVLKYIKDNEEAFRF